MDFSVTIGWSAVFIGVLLSLIGSVWTIYLAFNESLLWGLASLFFPLAAMNFGETWQPMVISCLGAIIMVIGFVILMDASGPDLSHFAQALL